MPQAKRYYSEDDPEIGVTPSRLKRLGKEKQLEYMRCWFNGLYVDPAEGTPYNGREGGYQYVWGGPYEANDELSEEFGDIVSETRIEEAVAEVERDGITEWAPGHQHPDMLRRVEEAEQFPDDEDPGPDLDSLIRQLEAGLSRRYGDDLETSLRRDFSDSLEALRKALADPASHGGIGHNHPPPDEDDFPDGMASALEATNLIAGELTKAEPDALAVAKATSRLDRVLGWIGGKLNIAVENFSKSFGSTLGVTAAGAIPAYMISQIPGIGSMLDNVIHHSIQWLQHVISPF